MGHAQAAKVRYGKIFSAAGCGRSPQIGFGPIFQNAARPGAANMIESPLPDDDTFYSRASKLRVGAGASRIMPRSSTFCARLLVKAFMAPLVAE